MKIETINKFNAVANEMVNEFINDYASGYTTDQIIQSDFEKLGDKKTDIEFIKKTIRIDQAVIRPAWRDHFNIELDNVMKSTYQFNYIANEIVAGLKRKADKHLKSVLFNH